MILGHLRCRSNEQIDIVLSGRPVSFDYTPYGPHFHVFREEIEKILKTHGFPNVNAVRKLLQPITEKDTNGWVSYLTCDVRTTCVYPSGC
jgi:hypothetical protein